MSSTTNKFQAGVALGAISTGITPSTTDNSTSLATTSYVQSNFNVFNGTSSIITVGTITTGIWSGSVIGINKGGTGQTTASASINALLPTQVGNTAKYLQTDGTNVSWGVAELIPTIQVGASYTAVDGDFVIINVSTHTTTFPIALLGKQVGVVMTNPTVTSILVKTSALGQTINGVDRSSTGFNITSQYEVYIFSAISATDWIITSTSRITKPILVTGSQDGTNKIFTIPNVPVLTTLQFYENGQLLSVTNDYTLSSSTLTYVSARSAPLVSDNLTAFAVPVQ